MIRLAALLLLLASPAAAHGNLPGGGGFATGFVHPFVATEHLLVLMALGLLMGRQAMRLPLIGLLGGFATGVAFGAVMPPQALILCAALGFGALISVNLRLPAFALIMLAGVTGWMVGADTDGITGATALMAFAGAVGGLLMIVLNSMAVGQIAAGHLNGVPLRVAGSWIAAAAMLVLAFLLRGSWSPA
jgi:urease accessory protein